MYNNPFADLEVLRRSIDELFQDFWPAGLNRRSAFLPGVSARGYPLLNLWENEDGLTVEALAPGLDPDSLEVSVQGDLLTIKGEKKPLPAVPREAYHRNERATGNFVRTLSLDCGIDDSHTSAEYRDGILTIELKRAPSEQPKKVKVKVK